jgi:hypothetical protein
MTAAVLFLLSWAQQKPFVVDVSLVLLSVHVVLIEIGVGYADYARVGPEESFYNILWPDATLLPVMEGVLRKVLYSLDVLKNASSPLGISMGLCLLPVAQVPVQSYPRYL